MIELYGIANSRAFRNLWMLEEIGLAYEHVPTGFEEEDLSSDAFAAINPNRRIPGLVDGDLRLFESLAINLYLARRYGESFWPRDVFDEARTYQWTLWAANELEPHLTFIARQISRVPEPERDLAGIAAARDALPRPLAVLDGALAAGPALAGPSFSVADLNVASVLASAVPIGYDFSAFAEVSAWFRACLSRPAAQRVVAMTRVDA